MKEYIEQFYNEGFATMFYLKPIKWIDNNIKNNRFSKLLKIIVLIVYTVVVLLFAVVVLYLKWPL